MTNISEKIYFELYISKCISKSIQDVLTHFGFVQSIIF